MKILKKEFIIPEKFLPGIKKINSTLKKNGYDCYIVGGSVRDLLLGRDVYDFDFTTNARPSELMKIFNHTVPTGIKHGTVTVLFDGIPYEVTTYRSDGKYIDGRHPIEVHFSNTLEEDIVRRDFTMNGLAYDFQNNILIDHVNGTTDINDKIIRTINNPNDRLSEDGLRSYRACRFAATLGFIIEENTLKAITKTLDVSKNVSAERIRDEFMKTLTASKPSIGLEYMRETGLMALFLPELSDCYGVLQNKYHSFDVYYHCLYSCDASPSNMPIIRLASLLHDIGKPITRGVGSDGDYTFYNHEIMSVKLVKNIMRRLKFSNEEISKTLNLIRNHMFHYTSDWSDGAVRRFIRKVGLENINDLIELRRADRSGHNTREGLPSQIYELMKRIDKIIEAENAISVKDLKINGNVIMKKLEISPGPIIGIILNELLEEILDCPEKNNEETLVSMLKDIYEKFDRDEIGKNIKKKKIINE